MCNETDDIAIVALVDLPSVITHIGFEDVDTLSLCTNSFVLGINCGDYQDCLSDTLNYENQAVCCSSYLGM